MCCNGLISPAFPSCLEITQLESRIVPATLFSYIVQDNAGVKADYDHIILVASSDYYSPTLL